MGSVRMYEKMEKRISGTESKQINKQRNNQKKIRQIIFIEVVN